MIVPKEFPSPHTCTLPGMTYNVDWVFKTQLLSADLHNTHTTHKDHMCLPQLRWTFQKSNEVNWLQVIKWGLQVSANEDSASWLQIWQLNSKRLLGTDQWTWWDECKDAANCAWGKAVFGWDDLLPFIEGVQPELQWLTRCRKPLQIQNDGSPLVKGLLTNQGTSVNELSCD